MYVLLIISLLKSWKANIDIQPVFNHYKSANYMRAYFPKSKDDTFEAKRQLTRETLNGNKSD